MNASADPVIAICVATYKRPRLLSNNITAITQLEHPEKHKVLVIVVDNDKEGTARSVVENISYPKKNNFSYFVEPARGLASVRNRLLEEAIKKKADYIGFIDDDEFPHPLWLKTHLNTLYKYNADIITGPVVSTHKTIPSDSIETDIKYSTGHIPRHIAAGNVFFKNTLIIQGKLRFDPYYNFIGGEDFDFFDQASIKGFTKIWCTEAIIYETITEERKTKKYLFFRHFTGAINNVLYYKRRKSTVLAWEHFLLKSLGKLAGGLYCLIAYLFTFDKRKLEKSIVKLASAFGYLSGLLNIVIERYR